MNFISKIEKCTEWLVAAVLIGTPLVFSGAFNISFSLPEVVFFRVVTNVAALGAIFVLWKTRRFSMLKDFFNSLPGLLFLAYFGVQMLASLFSIAPVVSLFGNYFRLQGLLTQLHYLLFAGVIVSVFQGNSIRKILGVMAGTGTFVAFYGVGQKFGIDPLFKTWQSGDFFGRIFSTLGQPNFLAQFLLLTLPPTFTLYFETENSKRRDSNFPTIKTLLLVGIFSQALALLLTLSRSSMAGLWLFLFLLTIGFSWRYAKKWGYAVAILFFIVLPMIGFIGLSKMATTENVLPGSFVSRFALNGESFRSTDSRLLLWSAAWKSFLDHPMLGSGPETFEYTFPKYQDPRLLTEEFYRSSADRAHNVVLDMLLNSGIIGVVAFAAFLCAFFKTALEAMRREKLTSDFTFLLCFTSGIAAFLVADLAAFEVIPQSLYFWTTVTLVLLIAHKKFAPISTGGNVILSLSKDTFPAYTGFALLLIFSAVNIFFWNFKPLLANYYFEQGIENSLSEPQKSTALFEKAAQTYPLEPMYQIYYARSLLQQIKETPDLDEILKLRKKMSVALDQLLLLAPQEREYHLILAESLENLPPEKEDFAQRSVLGLRRHSLLLEAAESEYQKALELSPNSPITLLPLGDFYFRQHRYEDAAAIYEQLLHIGPPYWKWSLEDLAKKSSYDRERYRFFFKDNPDFRSIFLSLGRSYAKLKNFDQALFYLEKGGETIDILSTEATIYAEQNHFQKAIELTEAALKLDPENELLQKNLRELKGRMGR